MKTSVSGNFRVEFGRVPRVFARQASRRVNWFDFLITVLAIRVCLDGRALE